MKIYVILALLAGYSALLVFGTWQVATGREAKKDLKVVEEQIKDGNQDAEAIRETIQEVNEERVVVVEKIVRLPAIPVTDCPLSDVVELQSQAYQAIMQVH